MRTLLEVIVQSVADARAAARAGADRLEVVRRIQDGGLTPPIALVREIAAEVSLPLRVMVRENAGYTTSPVELLALQRAAAALAELQVDGLVVGFAAAGEIELEPVSHVMDAAPGIKVTFHRAFDELRDPLAAIDAVAGVARHRSDSHERRRRPVNDPMSTPARVSGARGRAPDDHRGRWHRRRYAGVTRADRRRSRSPCRPRGP